MLNTYIIKMNRANPEKRFAPYEKTISHDFYGRDMCIFIAVHTIITLYR